MDENDFFQEEKQICDHYLYVTPYKNIQLHYVMAEKSSKYNDFFKKIEDKFSINYCRGLLYLAQTEHFFEEDVSFIFWRNFVNHYLNSLCLSSDTDVKYVQINVDKNFIEETFQDIPIMVGVEYLTKDVLENVWLRLSHEINTLLLAEETTLQKYLDTYFIKLKMVGKVYFHLAENKNNEEYPFIFLSTYSTKIGDKSQPKHLPLGEAIQNFSQNKNKKNIINILEPIQNAAKNSMIIRNLLESGDIFHPQLWSPKEALFFLKDIEKYEKNGIISRIPNWWNPKKPLKPQVEISIGRDQPKHISLDSLLAFDISMTLGEDALTQEEMDEILNTQSQLVRLRGNWVEVDKEKLNQVLSHWNGLQQKFGQDGLSFLEAMRLLSGAQITGDDGEQFDRDAENQEWSHVTAGKWFRDVLSQLRHPESNVVRTPDINSSLNATLRSYQKHGMEWLWLIYNMKLGGCLADDMGLGKTIQIISLLLCIKENSSAKISPSLLVVPTSLLANWKSELNKFAPSLSFKIVHSSQMNNAEIEKIKREKIKNIDLIIVTYSGIVNLSEFFDKKWNVLILDEAQAIKNANTKQTLICKKLDANVRFALTGTPVENKLSDLWSIFDFICPGLLGNAKKFYNYSKRLNEASKESEHNVYKPLRELVKPYILRRLKTDKEIISDLPDKTEMKTYCSLTKKQVFLYQKTVSEMEQLISQSEGIKRQGLIFSYLSQFKQICNHPDHWYGSGAYQEKESGKFQQLRKILEITAEKQEKVLIFTQFKEVTEHLARFAEEIFGQEGYVLHGGTQAKKRQEYVEAFNSEKGGPFFVLSIKAGGTGLNLVAASHVIHFDRWWNPAVENQATDRAFRIGQKKNVLVHKFICQGTIEERIDNMIDEKQGLSSEILEGEATAPLTEFSNDELIKLVSLDINKFDMIN